MNTLHTIDAQGKSLGRIASQAAILLMGKNLVSFEKNEVADAKVAILNVSKLRISPKKMKTVRYERYSGYPGGFKNPTMEQVVAKKGYSEIMKLAVYGMLPANKLRPRMMKNLTISE